MLKLLILLLLSAATLYGQQKPTPEWENRKYSMFIHFGLYSKLGGVWDGKPVTGGYSEQIQSHGGIFGDWYADVARDFNPVNWNPDSIALLARQAGMKSIVFTSKHHDGFCMYHTRFTDYNIVDATPYRRDIMKELAEACRRHGIRFGVYFSLIDWHFPQAYPISSHNADPLTPEHYAFNLKQVEEIMTGYGDISEIWFDMGSLTPEQSRGLYELVNRLQPSCMISGRLGNDCSDFSVMADNEYPDYKIGVPWQTAASFFEETWGYRSWQKRGEIRDKADEKIRSLVKVVSRGGNYLLNIGPMGDGRIVPFEKDVLLQMGQWLQEYGEALYGAKANPFDIPFPQGDVTVKGDTLYLFAEKNTKDWVLFGLRGNIRRVSEIGGEEKTFFKKNGEWVISFGEKHSSETPLAVLRVEMEGHFHIDPIHSRVAGGQLTASNSQPLYAYSGMDYYTGFQSTIAYTWGFRASKKTITPTLCYTLGDAGKEILLSFDGTERRFRLENGQPQKLVPKGMVWGNVFYRPSGSVFGRIPADSLSANIGREGSGWEKWASFKRDTTIQMTLPERRSILLLQEITSDRDQNLLVGIGSGNGVQIMLNGEVLTQHTSTRGHAYQEEIVCLPLKKGVNKLLLKLYNRFEKSLRFSIRTDVEQTVYRLPLESFPLGSGLWHQAVLRRANPSAPNEAMQLNNLTVTY